MSSQGIDESALNELFAKGENLLKRTPSGEKKEGVREKHNLLHDKYDTLKVILQHVDTCQVHVIKKSRLWEYIHKLLTANMLFYL